MKKTVLVTVAILLGFAIQISAQEKDTVRIKIGNKKIIMFEDTDDIGIEVDSLDGDYDIDFNDLKEKDECTDGFEGHWHGFEFGFNGLIDADNKMPSSDAPFAINMARSWTFGLNLFQKDIPLIKDNFGLVGGLGMQWRNYHFENNVEPEKVDGQLIWNPNEKHEFTKNRLQATYLTGVIAMEFQTPVGNSEHEFFVMAGAYGNYRMGSNLKQRWNEDGNKEKNKIRDDFYLNDLEYGLTGRIGIGKINFFANYSLTPLFKEDKLEGNWKPVTVGITIVGF
ncbi:MAG: hypothetical protein K9H64_16860 [Bacteroidales bacterium]|nr:hypothetical protein [Bacteroidales bacterium]MCF8457643.1 hypothetical protein [Bacteroidales bacterium]